MTTSSPPRPPTSCTHLFLGPAEHAVSPLNLAHGPFAAQAGLPVSTGQLLVLLFKPMAIDVGIVFWAPAQTTCDHAQEFAMLNPHY